MKQGLAQVVPGMRVSVETVFTRSLNKTDLDSRYHPTTLVIAEPAPGESIPAA
jgi:hypothetical protein